MNKQIDERMLDEDDGNDELARRLEAYASGRLSPDRFAVARMRKHVVEAAHGRERRTPGNRLFPLRRRLSALALAAALTLVGAAAVSASAMPGGPFYGARIWIQQLTLPADSSARSQARLDEIRQRLAEADAAARAHDADAVVAALRAYGDAVDDAFRDSAGDPQRLAQLQANLLRQLAHLQALKATIPAQSDIALTQAIERASDALDRVDGTDASASPATTAKPGKTAAPNPTAKPGKTAAPIESPQPSPKGSRTQQPASQ